MNATSRTWIGQVTKGVASLGELVDSCLVNIQEAARQEAEDRATLARLPAGDPRVVGTKDEPPLSYHIMRSVRNQAHWREYLAHYRGRVAKEGADKLIPVHLPRRFVKLHPEPPSWPAPREPGEDDADEQRP